MADAFFSTMIPRRPRSTLFPYTTLFRSWRRRQLPADAVPAVAARRDPGWTRARGRDPDALDRKSTRLNSSHVSISYAVFCLKKKKNHSHHKERRNENHWQAANAHLYSVP